MQRKKNMIYRIIEESISPQEFNRLRKAVGWEEREIQDIKLALKNTKYIVVVKDENNENIGMARIIGDEGIYYYIQDVIVLPKYQNEGIGKQIMEKIMKYIELHKKKGLFVGLMSAKQKEGFYKKFGFMERPSEKYGAGMFIKY